MIKNVSQPISTSYNESLQKHSYCQSPKNLLRRISQSTCGIFRKMANLCVDNKKKQPENLNSSDNSLAEIREKIPELLFISVMLISFNYCFKRIKEYYPLGESFIEDGLILGGKEAIKWMVIDTSFTVVSRLILHRLFPRLSSQLNKWIEKDTESNFSRLPPDLLNIDTYSTIASLAFLEEILFRGGFTDVISENMSFFTRNISILPSASLITKLLVNITFVLVHPEKNPYFMTSFFFIGWKASILREQTQNLWTSSFFHTFFNITALLIKTIIVGKIKTPKAEMKGLEKMNHS